MWEIYAGVLVSNFLSPRKGFSTRTLSGSLFHQMSGLRPPVEELITFHRGLPTCQISFKMHKTLRLTQGAGDNEHPQAVLLSLFI